MKMKNSYTIKWKWQITIWNDPEDLLAGEKSVSYLNAFVHKCMI